MVTALLVIAAGVAAAGALYRLLAWWSGRRVRAEREMREAIRRGDPPVLGGARPPVQRR